MAGGRLGLLGAALALTRRPRTLAGIAVVCAALAAPAAGTGAIQITQSSFAIPDGTFGLGTVDCGQQEPLGTGYGSTGGVGDLVFLQNAFFPSGGQTDVRVYADNLPGGPDVQGVAQLVCDSQAGPGDYRMRKTETINSFDGGKSTLFSECKAGESVVGGYVDHDGAYADEMYVGDTGPYDGPDKGKVPDDGWKGTVINHDDPGDQFRPMNVYAFCDTKHDNVEYVSKTRNVGDGALKGSSVSCGGRRLIGGGVTTEGSNVHQFYVADTLRDQGKWESGVYNRPTPDGNTREITTTAICLG